MGAKLTAQSTSKPTSRPTSKSTAKSNRTLKHHGILGMRWGIRRYRGPNGRIIPGKYVAPGKAAELRKSGGSTPAAKSEDHLQAQEIRKKKASQMTNAELRQVLERMDLERRYKDAKTQEISAGKKAVSKTLNRIGERVAGKAVDAAVNAAFFAALGNRKK